MKQFIIGISKWLGIQETATATILVTISVFLLGILINAFIKEYSNHSKRSVNRILIKLNLSNLVKGLSMQIEGFKIFQSCLDIDSIEPFIINHKVIIQIDSIHNIGYTDIFKSYFSGIRNWIYNEDDIRIKCVNDLWSNVHHLYSYNEKNKEDALNIVERLEAFTDLTNFSFQKALRQLESFLLLNSGKEVEAEFATFFKFINDSVNNLKSLPNYNEPSKMNEFFILMSVHITANNELCIKNKDKIDVIEISESLNLANHRYRNHFFYLKAQIENYSNKISTYNKYIKELNYCNKHLCGVKSQIS